MDTDDDATFSGNEEVETTSTEYADEDAPRTGEGLTESPPSNWTVVDAGKTPIATSNDLNQWTIDQLRLECTARKLRVKRGDGEIGRRIVKIQESNNDRDIARCVPDPTGWRLRKIDHTIIRLINVLFSDTFVHRLVRSEDQLTRAQIEAKDFGGNSSFWTEMHEEFSTNTTDYNGKFLGDDLRYDKVQPSIITDHSATALYKLWKDLLPVYRIAYNNSVVSGQHDSDFMSYCHGRLDINYIHAVVGEKHVQVMNFVRGGMPTNAQLDSTKHASGARGRGQTARAPKSKSVDVDTNLRETLSELTKLFNQEQEQRFTAANTTRSTGRLPELLDSITKTHNLISQLQATLAEDRIAGRHNEKLIQRIARMEAGLEKLETEYDELVGLAPPKKRARHSVDEETVYIL